MLAKVYPDFEVRIVVPKRLAEICLKRDSSVKIDKARASAYIQAKDALRRKYPNHVFNWVDGNNCRFEEVGPASWADKEPEPESEPTLTELEQLGLF